MVENEPEAIVGLVSDHRNMMLSCVGKKSFLCKSLKSLDTTQISQEDRNELVV